MKVGAGRRKAAAAGITCEFERGRVVSAIGNRHGGHLAQILKPRILLLGLLSWLIPFLAASLFFGPGGELWADRALFKSAMVVIGGGVGLWLLLRAFRAVPATLATGAAIGIAWLLINLGLDLAILLPMSGMGLATYAADIGLRYLLLPLTAAAMGLVAERAKSRS